MLLTSVLVTECLVALTVVLGDEVSIGCDDERVCTLTTVRTHWMGREVVVLRLRLRSAVDTQWSVCVIAFSLGVDLS